MLDPSPPRELCDWAFQVVNDDRLPILISHNKICYPPPNPDFIDRVDTSYPGVVIDFDNGYYLIEDGVHRIGKWQKQGVYESLFYVVTRQEFKDGMVDMIYINLENRWDRCTMGEWCHEGLDPVSHRD